MQISNFNTFYQTTRNYEFKSKKGIRKHTLLKIFVHQRVSSENKDQLSNTTKIPTKTRSTRAERAERERARAARSL